MKHLIAFEVIYTGTFSIEAESEEDALAEAESMCEDGYGVREGDLADVHVSI